ncbi:hypothetical protein D9756_005406 [Leucocoprinus leucothites]|uniref:Uncharacterized protein n=1 Tax=Leucocoprinus leucothites TaxID=201217 RepID=A0A8H5D7D3_9AGAR|nr:hypothetical protein D9756_005406 [Leucoagaricus leucothites]
MEAGSKRKRDLDCPRITFHAPGRTFMRLFREDSLEGLKNAVKTKLGLEPNATISLTQMQNGPDVVLEDEDDFDAFYNVLHSAKTATIRVTTKQATALNQARPVLWIELKMELTDSLARGNFEQEEAEVGCRFSDPNPRQYGSDSYNLNSYLQETSPKRSKSTSNTMPSSAASAQASAALPPAQDQDGASSTANQGAETDAKKSKRKGKKATKDTSSETPRAVADVSITEAIEKANENIARKSPVTESTLRSAGSGEAVLLPTKELPATGVGNQKEAKAKKPQSTVVNPPQKASPVSASKKKRGRSKSKVREATTSAVDSETNETVSSTPDPQINTSLATISRLMIEKYLIPASSMDNMEPAAPIKAPVPPESTSDAQPDNVLSEPTAQIKPTCPYCGKILTHDRSRCPMIRAKNLHIIENRITELKEDATEDTDSVRANAIEILEAALLRKRGAEFKKVAPSNVSSSERPSTKLFSSTMPTPKTMKNASSVTEPPPSARRSPSPSSSNSDESIPLQKSSQKPAPQHKIALLQKSPSPPQIISGSPSMPSKTAVALTRTGNNSETESPLGDEVPQPRTKTDVQAEDSDSESSGSSEVQSPQFQHDPLPSAVDISGYSDKDLEVLIRGPGSPLKSVELPSSESSEDEAMEGEDDQLENELEGPRGHSRQPQRSYAPSNDSSDEEIGGDDENEDEPFYTPSGRGSVASIPPIVSHLGEVGNEFEKRSQPVPLPIPEQPQPLRRGASFQEMNRRLSSVEADKVGNDAFEQVLIEENAVFDLARRESPQSSLQEVTPRLGTKYPQSSLGPDQGQDTEGQEPESSEAAAAESKSPGDSLPEDVDEAEPVQATELDPVETHDALEDTRIRQRSPIEAAEDHEVPTRLPIQEPSPQVPERELTPKPGIVQRMRNRAGLASPPKEHASSSNLNSNLTIAPGAKPRSTRAATLRSQKLATIGSGQGEDATNVADVTPVTPLGKPNLKKCVMPVKPVSTRSKAAAGRIVAEANGDEERPDPPPRRSTRAASRIVATTSQPQVASIPNDSQPTARRTRQSKAASISEDATETSQIVIKNQTKRTKKNEAKAATKSPIPSPSYEDAQSIASGSQATENHVPLPPSPPMSLDAWETIPAETSGGATHSDAMVDELQTDVEAMEPIPFPLKPQFQRKSAALGRKQSLFRLEQAISTPEDHSTAKRKGKGKDIPLFMPSESQDAFPYSQFQSELPDPEESDSSNSEAEVRKAVVKKPPASQSQPTRYRKLSDIASQTSKLFTPKLLRQSTGLLQSTPSVPSKRKERLNQMYGMMGKNRGDDDSDDDSGQGSDSDVEKASHIPRSRKAGAGLKGRMSVA